MEFKKIMSAVALMGAMAFGASSASANSGAMADAIAQYGGAVTCTSCHADGNGSKNTLTAQWLQFGGGANKGPTDWAGFGAADADGDGQDNATELAAGTQAYPAAAASSGGGGGGCVTSSIATPLTMALAMLTLGFFVRRKKD